MIGQDETVNGATSLYRDDIFVNESVCLAAQVKTHLELFGQTCKDPEQLSSVARVLAYMFGRSTKSIAAAFQHRYDTKQSDGEVPVMLELWGLRITPSLPSLPGPLLSGMVAPDRPLSMG